ncbi:MAG: hypothetical protein H7Y37_01020 [Anaerolineae bacterium]|nr:hypothetical protein [Gloeobacterales cyanobacterium ES-bin-313]
MGDALRVCRCLSLKTWTEPEMPAANRFSRTATTIVILCRLRLRLPFAHPDIGEIDVGFIGQPDPLVNSVGVKGLGEAAMVGTAPGNANAIFQAAARTADPRRGYTLSTRAVPMAPLAKPRGGRSLSRTYHRVGFDPFKEAIYG